MILGEKRVEIDPAKAIPDPMTFNVKLAPAEMGARTMPIPASTPPAI